MAKKKKENDIVTDGSRAITKFHVSDVVMVVILVILCATCVVPFIHLLAKSVSSNTAVLAKRVSFWPIGFNLDAYTSIFEDGSMVRSFLYSVVVTLVFTLMGMIACTCAAYPLSRKRLKGRTFFTFILMFPMYFSAGLIPTYLLYSDLHMLDTVWVLILPLIYAPYNMLIMKTYFQSNIPDSLEEAAFLDGATNFQIFRKITMPYLLFVTGPALITDFVKNINNFNVIYLLTQDVYTTTNQAMASSQAKEVDLLVTWLFRLTQDYYNYKMASAIGIIVFIICAVFTLVAFNRMIKGDKEGTYQ